MTQGRGENGAVGEVVDLPGVGFLPRHAQGRDDLGGAFCEVFGEVGVGDVADGPVFDEPLQRRRLPGPLLFGPRPVAHGRPHAAAAAAEFLDDVAAEVAGCSGDENGGHCSSFRIFAFVSHVVESAPSASLFVPSDCSFRPSGSGVDMSGKRAAGPRGEGGSGGLSNGCFPQALPEFGCASA